MSYWMSEIASEFYNVYAASLEPAVRAAYLSTAKDGERLEMFKGLAADGYIVDIPIMVWNLDPFVTMLSRFLGGYTWVPNALQPPVLVAPGLDFPGLPSYDPNPPKDSILVYDPRDKANWPKPFDPPVVNNAPASDKLVGEYHGGVYLSTLPGQKIANGEVITQDGVQYRKIVTVGLMGAMHFWAKVGE